MSSSTPQLPPSTSPLSSNLDFISRAKTNLYSTLSTRRPWRQIFANIHSFSIPSPLSSSFSRLKTNLSYFRMNFALFVLLVLFLSLLWSPLSLIVFLVIMIAWLFLFFLRDDPLHVFGRVVDDRIVLGVLSVVTVGCLLLTGDTFNILVSVGVGVGVVLVYSIFRKTDDLFVDEDEAVGSGLLSGRTGV